MANDQEILLKVMSPSKFIGKIRKFFLHDFNFNLHYYIVHFYKASYETCIDEIIENDKKAEMDKLISKFNKREKQIVKDFVQTMRFFFSN